MQIVVKVKSINDSTNSRNIISSGNGVIVGYSRVQSNTALPRSLDLAALGKQARQGMAWHGERIYFRGECIIRFSKNHAKKIYAINDVMYMAGIPHRISECACTHIYNRHARTTHTLVHSASPILTNKISNIKIENFPNLRSPHFFGLYAYAPQKEETANLGKKRETSTYAKIGFLSDFSLATLYCILSVFD